jgi:hypothetical protein
MRSSQDSTSTCSMLDWLAWDKQSLALDKSTWTCEYVHVWDRGCIDFTDESTTSWAISSVA